MQAVKPPTSQGLLADSLRRMAPLNHPDEDSNANEHSGVDMEESEVEGWSAINGPLGLACSIGGAGSSSNRRKQTKPSRMADDKTKASAANIGDEAQPQSVSEMDTSQAGSPSGSGASVADTERSDEEEGRTTSEQGVDQSNPPPIAEGMSVDSCQLDLTTISSSKETINTTETTVSPVESVPRVAITCGVCSLEFNSEMELGVHVHQAHSNIQPNISDSRNAEPTTLQQGLKLEAVVPVTPTSDLPTNTISKSPLQLTSMSDSMASAVAMANSQQYSGSTRDEDYCDLCQKHFCNKYYLRKHKNDVHGIVTDQSFGARSTVSVTPKKDYHHVPPVLSSLPHFGIPNPMSTGAHPSHPMFMSPHMMNPLSAANFMLFHPFAAAAAAAGSSMPMMNPAHFLSMPPPGQHAPPVTLFSSPPQSMSLTMSHPSQSLTTGCDVTPPGIDSKPQPGSDPETYCPICHVEVCNKYFLRIHMASKHGIKDEMTTSPLPQPQTNTTSAAPATPVSTSHTVSWQPKSTSPPLTPGVTNNNNSLSTTQVKDENEPENLCLPKQQCSPLGLKAESLLPPSSLGLDNPFAMGDTKLSADLMACYANRQIDPEAFCTLCNREFANKYTLKIHFLNMHATPGSEIAASVAASLPDSAEALMAAVSTSSAMPSSGGPPGSVLSPPIDAFKNSMIAAKLADRVTCDICQKDLCNKYFLKTHKMKVHGVITTSEPNSPPRSAMENTTLSDDASSNQDTSAAVRPLYLGMGVQQTSPKPPMPTTPKLPQQQQQQVPTLDNITSEVYCELCKKEVGPKYLFRNHMLTIHGIGGPGDVGMPGFMGSFGGGPPISLPSYRASSVASNDSSAFNGHGAQMQFTGSLGSPGGRSNSTGGKWSRESPNQMRVLCDICDKWICNKYFLRTHKLNKHGIVTAGMTPTSKQMTTLSTQSISSSNPADLSTDLHLSTSTAVPPPPPTTTGTSGSNSPHLPTTSQDGAGSECSGTSRKPASGESIDATIDAVISSNNYPSSTAANDPRLPAYFHTSSQEAMAAAAQLYTQDYLSQHYAVSGQRFDPRLFLSSAPLGEHLLPPPPLGATAAATAAAHAAAAAAMTTSPMAPGAVGMEGMPVCTLCGLLCPDTAKLHKHIEQVHSNPPKPEADSNDTSPLNLCLPRSFGSPLKPLPPTTTVASTVNSHRPHSPPLRQPLTTNGKKSAALRSIRKARYIRWKHQHQQQQSLDQQHTGSKRSRVDPLSEANRVLLWRYECGECGASFQSRQLLHRHVTDLGHWMGRAVEVSQGQEMDLPVQDFLRCPLCTAKVEDLVEHLLKDHDLERAASLIRADTASSKPSTGQEGSQEPAGAVSPHIEFELTELSGCEDDQRQTSRMRSLACERVTLPVREMIREPLLVRLNPLIGEYPGVVQD